MLSAIKLASPVIILLVVLLFYKLRFHSLFTVEAPSPSSSSYSGPTQHAKAVILRSRKGPYILVHDNPRPQISFKEILIRNRAVGLNPIDWKCVTYGFGIHELPWISGRESAGVVEEIGADVNDFEIGDRVWVASTNYRDNRTSTFQEGATLGVGCVSAAGALFDSLGVPWPANPPYSREVDTFAKQENPWILIWGASSVTGMMAIQFAKLCNFRVFAVAGCHNTSELCDLGADVVVDRHKPEEVVEKARGLHMKLGIDCVGKETATYALRALQPGSKLVCLVQRPDQGVLRQAEIGTSDVLIKRFHEDQTYGYDLVNFLSHHLFARTLRPVKFEVVEGGLGAVEDGLQKLRDQAVSGKRLILRVE
ncbi:MAG: hypothetical protein Q9195_006701 [Heterodermia aff. obscurata]